MTKTKKNPLKEQREWNELLHAKKAYILRKQQEEDADRLRREYDPYNGRWEQDDDSPQ